MEHKQFLKEVTALPGLTGNEIRVAEYIKSKWEPLADDVVINSTNSVIAHKSGKGPKIMFAAHLDEIGLMVSRIEEDGSLRVAQVGGVDPRILPAMRVKVLAKDGALTGVVGAKAPHLLTEEERGKNYSLTDLYVDLGMSAEAVKSRVCVGDEVQLEYRFVDLLNNRIAVKTCDDRACVTILYRAMQLLQNMKHEADLYFVATCQEEIGLYGAKTAAFGINPDFGVALDVCHAHTPDSDPCRTNDIDAVVASKGPYINSFLRDKLQETADEQNVRLQTSVARSYTSTDLDNLSVQRAGIPAVLIELPLKYMHTSVENIDTRCIDDAARLLANFAQKVSADWEEELWI